MIFRRFAATGVAWLFAAGLFAQGLTTNASKDDWEEINFEFNSSILSDGYPSLLRLAELLQQHRDYRVRLTGHTDYVGSTAYNEKLGLARANTVRDFLVKYGANANQVAVEAQGERSPAVDNRTKEGRFMNRRVVLTVTDAQGKIIGAGGVGDAIRAFDESAAKKQEQCCENILKRLDKLDDILAALRDLKGEHDKLRTEVDTLRSQQQALRDQVAGLPKPLTTEQTTEIARAENLKALEEAQRRNRKFSLLGLNVGPTFGGGRTGNFTLSGRGRYFSPFGGTGTHAVQAEAEYMYYPGRQEGQFDIGLLNRWNRFQVGLFSSFKYVHWKDFEDVRGLTPLPGTLLFPPIAPAPGGLNADGGGWLWQAAVTLDYLFSRGRIGLFATRGLRNESVVGRQQFGPFSYTETYMRIGDQVGASTTLGLAGDTYLEANLGYIKSYVRADRPGGMARFVAPLNERFAFTAELGLNETFMNFDNSGRVVFGFQFGNWLRPKEYMSFAHPVPADIPRIRYNLATRRVGNSAPVANAGPDLLGVQAGTITLSGAGSFDPEGDPLTFRWEQLAGPSVAITGMNAATMSFAAAEGQSYSFRLVVRDPSGLQGVDTVTVSAARQPDINIVRCTATPSTIAAGGQAILEWQVENAASVSIAPGIGSVRASGTATVMPQQTTTYTLTATGPRGEQRCLMVVTVGPSNPQILRFEAVPTNITSGESSTLSWTTQNATRVTLSGGIGEVPASGSRVVSPRATTTYVLTATGADGRNITASAVVTVGTGQVPRILQFSGTPTQVDPGQPVQLCWNVENATDISINPGGSAGLRAQDCITVNPTATTAYTLTARNTQGTVTAVATIHVGQVRILTFTNSPEFSQRSGDPVTLSWTTQNASYVIVTGLGAPNTQLPANGSITVNPTTNTSYTLTAYGAGGSVSAVLHVFVR